MKNHIKVNGKLLQTNKKWSHLKEKQKTWIYETTKEAHAAFVAENDYLPRKKQKETVVDKVMEKIAERDIWIPYYEARPQINKFIDRLNRKSPLYQPTQKQIEKAQKPKPPQSPFSEFPVEVRESLIEMLSANIARYINQTHKAPPNRIRDNNIKMLLKGFNAKKYHKYGMKMQADDCLLLEYDRLRKQIFAEHDRQGLIPELPTKQEKNRIAGQSEILRTERLILRKMSTKDWKDIREMLADPEVMYAWERTFTTKREVMEWIIRQLNRYKREQVGYFAAIDKESGQMVGQIGLMWNDIQGSRCLEVGYILKKEFWNKGYAAEGAKACIEYGFRLYGVNAIYATIRPENSASISVAERIGMELAGEYVKTYEGKKMKHLIYCYKNPTQSSVE